MRQQRTHFRAFRLLPFALLLLFPLAMQGQVDQGPCDTCWKNYTYLDNFIIGGHNVPIYDEFSDLFTLEFSQIYRGSGWSLKRVLDTTVSITWTADTNHPWGGTWGTTDPIGPYIWDTVSHIELGFDKMEVEQALERGMKFYFHPDLIPDMMKGGVARESYYVKPRGFQYFGLLEKVFGTNSYNQGWKRANLNELSGGFYWSYTVPSSSDPDSEPILMAGRPDWVTRAMLAEYGGLYDAAWSVVRDENGNERQESERDSLRALYNKLKWMSVGFAINTDIDSLNSREIGDNEVIAYADLYVHDGLGQDTCNCNIMRFWKRINITKKWFLEVVDKGRHLQAINDNGEVYFDIDTLLDFTDVWDNVHTTQIGPDKGQKYFYDTTENGGSQTIDTTCVDCPDWCEQLLAERLALPSSDSLYLPPGSRIEPLSAWESKGFTYRFFTTRLVPIGFLRSRIATPHFTNLRDGVYDSLIAHAVDGLYADSLVDSLIGRVGVGDEAGNLTFRAQGMLAAKLQRAMAAHPVGKDRPKQLWMNPAHDFDGFRLYTGDFDSTEFRQIHMAARQQYRFNGGDILPLYYANTDSISAKARDSMFDFYKPDYIDTNGDTIIDRMIAGANLDDYRSYRSCVQEQAFGKYLDSKRDLAFLHSPLVVGVSKLSDVFRSSYAERFPNIPKTPIWNVVQVHGFVSHANYINDIKIFSGFGGSRTVTPEEIAAQAWLTMNCGANGMVFGDLQLDGSTFGLGSLYIDSSLRNMEYGRLRFSNPAERSDEDTLKHIDSMWLGLGSRRAATLESIRELRHIDRVVGWKYLVENRYQISIHDTRQSFSEIPMLRDVRTERAKQQDYSIDESGNWSFNGSDTFDTRSETFMEATIFRPDSSAGFAAGECFLLLTNRLTWPVDTLRYSERTIDLFDSLHPWFPCRSVGLGAIDVRRPVILLANSTDFLADSLVIGRITRTGSWIDTVAFGDTLVLDWQLPGRGAMYRLRPLRSVISEHGVAYNNAVRSENPSTESKARDRLVVYERDSVVYMRAVDSTGAWSAEVMVSDPNDTVLVDGERTASNYFPALAVSRAGKGYLRIVWERDSSDYRSVMSRLFLSDSITRDSIRDPELIDYGYTLLQRLDSAELWEASWNMTPAIVAASDDHGEAGFVVSWADQSKGVNVLVVREQTDLRYYRRDGLSPVAFYDTASVRQVRNIDTSDRVSRYPTLANVPRQAIVNFRASDCFGVSGTIPGIVKEKELPETLADIEDPREVTLLHLSYQQGDGVDNLGEEIYYHRLGVTIPSNAKRQPGLWIGKDEHVTKNLRACSFEHPSIAADSVRIGVSFEVVTSDIGGLPVRRHIGLRFRDTTGMDRLTGIPLKAWETYLYRWVGSLMGGISLWWGGRYERPSLTHFPSIDSLRLVSQPEGGLTWFRRDGPDGRAYPQFLYRYGWFEPREIGDGKDPTLTLVPLIKIDPFERTSIFHRSDDSSRVAGLNDEGATVWRYPARLLNSPGNPMSALFSGLPPTGGIIANVKARLGWHTECYVIGVDWRFGLIFARGSLKHPDDDRHGPGDPKILSGRPGLPPSYFLGPGDGRTVVSDLSESEEVVRTSLFIVEDGPVRLRRIVASGKGIIDYLNGFGWDTERKAPADIWTVVELVRFSDSVVLWRSDTLSARGLDSLKGSLDGSAEIPTHTAADSVESVSEALVDEFLEIPAHTVADSGEIVWARMRSFATEGVAYKMTSGFTHYRFDSTSVGLQKRSTPWRIERGEDQSSREGGLRVEVLPNPLRDRGEVRVRVRESGEVRVSLWNLFGEQLAELPMIDSEGAGEYSVEVDMSAAKSGTYLLRVESIDEFATAMFTVLR